MEVGVATGPVADLAEGKRDENILRSFEIILTRWKEGGGEYLGLSVNKTDSILIDGYQEKFWVVLVRALLHLEER